MRTFLSSPGTAVKRNGRSGFSNEVDGDDDRDRHGRRLPFDFSFDSFYSGRKQDLQDAVALESGTVRKKARVTVTLTEFFHGKLIAIAMSVLSFVRLKSAHLYYSLLKRARF
jgi:hypothetical protein